MQIADKVSGRDWALIGARAREGEQPTIPHEHYLVSTEDQLSSAREVNSNIRSCVLHTQNVDKGHFNPQQEGLAAVAVDKAEHGKYAWRVFFQQGQTDNAFLVAARTTIMGDDATWEAPKAWANFNPMPGKRKIHHEFLFSPAEFTHAME
jgi:hypothetical protein